MSRIMVSLAMITMMIATMISCVDEQHEIIVKQSLCTAEDQENGLCDDPFSLLPTYTMQYAQSVSPSSDVNMSSLSCGPFGSGTKCTLTLDLPGGDMLVVHCYAGASGSPGCESYVAPHCVYPTYPCGSASCCVGPTT